MVRVLVTGVLAILLYNALWFVYLLLTDHVRLNDYYMNMEFRQLNSRINERLSLKREVRILEFIPDAQEACLTGIDIDPLYELEKKEIKDIDYYYGVFGPFGWVDTSTYITVYRKDNKATIINPDYFYIDGHYGGCADGRIILKADDEGRLYFSEPN